MMSLYRKYRPAQFDDLEGQEHITSTLKEASKQGRLTHAYLFAGPRGTGKTSSARILAKALTCHALLPDGNPCNVCLHCTSVNDGSAVDVVEIDAASHRGIDDMKDLTSTLHYHPTYASKRVYIIDEVHMLTKESFNALLKALEEPPAFVHFILATTEAHKILPTIISRCQFYQFQSLRTTEIASRLQYVLEAEQRDVPSVIISRIAQMARGGMRDALTQLERVLSIPNLTEDAAFAVLGAYPDKEFADLFVILQNKDLYGAMDLVQQADDLGKDADQFVRGLLHYVHGQFAHGVSTQNHAMISLCQQLLSLLQQCIRDMQHADLPYLALKISIVTWCDVAAGALSVPRTPAEAFGTQQPEAVSSPPAPTALPPQTRPVAIAPNAPADPQPTPPSEEISVETIASFF